MFNPKLVNNPTNVVEVVYQKGDQSLTLKLREQRSPEADAALQRFLAIDLADRTEDATMELVRETVCSLLVEDPKIEGFPKGKTPLRTRALEYFTLNGDPDPDNLKQTFDDILMNAYNKHGEASRPIVFFRLVPGTNETSNHHVAGAS